MKTKTSRGRKNVPLAAASNSETLVEHWRRTRQPVALKVNDGLVFQIQDDRSIDLLAKLIERLDNVAAVRAGFADLDAGRTMSLDEFQAKVRAKNAIPD